MAVTFLNFQSGTLTNYFSNKIGFWGLEINTRNKLGVSSASARSSRRSCRGRCRRLPSCRWSRRTSRRRTSPGRRPCRPPGVPVRRRSGVCTCRELDNCKWEVETYKYEWGVSNNLELVEIFNVSTLVTKNRRSCVTSVSLATPNYRIVSVSLSKSLGDWKYLRYGFVLGVDVQRLIHRVLGRPA